MTVSDHWTEVLRCPNCALTGVAVLSQPNGSDSVLVMLSQRFLKLQIRARMRETWVAVHSPPRAVSMPFSFNPSAMARRLVAPLACSSLIIEAMSAAQDAIAAIAEILSKGLPHENVALHY